MKETPQPNPLNPEIEQQVLGRLMYKLDIIQAISESLLALNNDTALSLPSGLRILKGVNAGRNGIDAPKTLLGGRGLGFVNINLDIPAKPNSQPEDLSTYIVSSGLDPVDSYIIEIGEHIDTKTVDEVDKKIANGQNESVMYHTYYVLGEHDDGSLVLHKFNSYLEILNTGVRSVRLGPTVAQAQGELFIRRSDYFDDTIVYYKGLVKPGDFQMIGTGLKEIEKRLRNPAEEVETHESDEIE